MATKKVKAPKGQLKTRPDTDDPDKNPLLHVENKHDFKIETANLLEIQIYSCMTVSRHST